MKNLRNFRILLAAVLLVASVAYLCLAGTPHPPKAILSVPARLQLVPSAIASTIGVTVFWLLGTAVFGRVYCSTVCPVGTLQDCAIRIRRLLPGHKPRRFRPARRWRYDILLAYVICLLLGVGAVCFTLEPWNMTRSAAAAVNTEAVSSTWSTLAYGATVGAITGIVSLLAIFVWALYCGREFCNTVCPIGTALSVVTEYSLLHIEIDPDKCSGCLKCEDVCRADCIKVVSRYVDNSRCVRCFDCLSVCPDDAIHYQINRNRRPATPLLQKRKKA